MQTTNPTGLTNPYGEPPWAAPHPQSPAHFCKESNAFVSHPHSHNITFAKSPMLWRRGTSNPLYCRQLVRKSANGLCGTMQFFFIYAECEESSHTYLSGLYSSLTTIIGVVGVVVAVGGVVGVGVGVGVVVVGVVVSSSS